MPRLRLFGPAGEAAGTGATTAPGATVGDVLSWAGDEFGPAFVAVLGTSRIWVNGEPAPAERPLTDADEVAVLPPVSGG